MMNAKLFSTSCFQHFSGCIVLQIFRNSFTGDCAIIRSNHDNSAPPSIYPGDSKSLRVLEAGSLLAKEYFLNF